MLVMQFLASMQPEHDGVTRVAFRLREGFKNSAVQQKYVTPMLPPSENADMIKIASVPFPLSTGYRLAVCSQSSIRKILIQNKPDLIHIHTLCSLGFASVKAARSLKIPVVATFHTNFPSYLSYYRVSFMEKIAWAYIKYLYNLCDAVIVPSQTMLGELQDRGLKNLVHISHGVDTLKFSPKLRSQAWREKLGCADKSIVLFAGRLVWEKNLKFLANSLARVKSTDKMQVVIAGDGPARSALQKIMPTALFIGQLPVDELAVAYASSDIFAFPSATETFGNVTIEAMASALPPVCISAGGACDLVATGKNGILIASQNEAAYAQAIDSLINDLELRKKLSDGALNTIPNYCWNSAKEKYSDLYERVFKPCKIFA